MLLLVPLVLSLLGGPAVLVLGRVRRNWAAPVGGLAAALAFLSALSAAATGAPEVDMPWAPSLNLRLQLRLDGLALRRAGLLRVLVASLSARSQPVLVRGLGAQARVRIMDETNAEAAMRWPERFRAQAAAPIATNGGTLALELRPYALVLIDTV